MLCCAVCCPPQKLMDLATAANLKDKIEAMFKGEHINSTEDRAVLHVATRARREQVRMRLGAGLGAGGGAAGLRFSFWGGKGVCWGCVTAGVWRGHSDDDSCTSSTWGIVEGFLVAAAGGFA
jgi:hypothetical protein